MSSWTSFDCDKFLEFSGFLLIWQFWEVLVRCFEDMLLFQISWCTIALMILLRSCVWEQKITEIKCYFHQMTWRTQSIISVTCDCWLADCLPGSYGGSSTCQFSSLWFHSVLFFMWQPFSTLNAVPVVQHAPEWGVTLPSFRVQCLHSVFEVRLVLHLLIYSIIYIGTGINLFYMFSYNLKLLYFVDYAVSILVVGNFLLSSNSSFNWCLVVGVCVLFDHFLPSWML